MTTEQTNWRRMAEELAACYFMLALSNTPDERIDSINRMADAARAVTEVLADEAS